MELNEIGLDALSRELSPIDVARFLRLHEKGSGDYTKEREAELEDVTINDIRAGIKNLRENY
jgi:hypothetical protein